MFREIESINTNRPEAFILFILLGHFGKEHPVFIDYKCT